MAGFQDEQANRYLLQIAHDAPKKVLPEPRRVITILQNLQSLLLPDHLEMHPLRVADIQLTLEEKVHLTHDLLLREIATAYRSADEQWDAANARGRAEDIVYTLFRDAKAIREMLLLDADAGYKGDPAARDATEIILTYPGFEAIMTHRIAHALHKQGVPYLPRIMSEYAHSKTGIDIHPGATIGKHFFMDHGTGIVIGETTEIGDHVKVYQGVTLGALSLPVDESGETTMRGKKRHPTLEDHVVVYAGATILGAITIGEGSIVGGNVWITESVPAGSTVYQDNPKPRIRNGKN